MPTRVYLPSSGTLSGTTAVGAWSVNTGAVLRPAKLTKSDTPLTNGTARTKGNATVNADRLDTVYVLEEFPLAAQTISGTFSAVLQGLESSTALDMWLQIRIRVLSADRQTIRATLYAGSTATVESATTGAENQEYTTALQSRIKNAIALTSYTCVDGDLLSFEIGYRANGTSTTATGTLRYGDPASGSDAALTAGTTSTTVVPWIELSANLTFQSTGGGGGGTGQAVLFTGDPTGLQCATAPPTTHTMTCWLYLETAGNYSTWYEPSDGTTAHYVQCSGGSNDGNISAAITSNTSDASSGVAMATGGWYKFILRHNFAANVVELQFQPPGSSTWQSYTGNCDTSPTWDRFSLGYSDAWPNEPFRGRIAAPKIWGAILSDAERDAEFTQYRAVRTADLFTEHLMEGAVLTDYSGNGRALTNPGGTMPTSADGPPGLPYGGDEPPPPAPTNQFFHVLAA